jgi:hypothetical protein
MFWAKSVLTYLWLDAAQHVCFQKTSYCRIYDFVYEFLGFWGLVGLEM